MTRLPYRLWRRESDIAIRRSRERRNVVTEAGHGLLDYLGIGLGLSLVVGEAFLHRFGRYIPATIFGAAVLIAALK